MKSNFILSIFLIFSFFVFSVEAKEKVDNTKKKINSQAFKLCQTAVKVASEGDYDMAVIYLKRALEIEPKFPDALFNIGSIYRVQKKYQDSYVAFQQLLIINPNDNEARLEKVLTLIAMKSFKDASTELAKVPNSEKRYAGVKSQLDKAIAKGETEAAKETKPAAPIVYESKGLYSAQMSGKEKLVFSFSTPTGITSDDENNVYVANFSGNTIEKISPDGKRRQLFAAGDLLSGPSGLTFDDRKQELLVSNYKSGTIIKISKNGQMTLLLDQLEKPYSLFLQKDGRLYISEQGKKAVSVVNIP